MADFKELVGEELFAQVAAKVGEKKILVSEKENDYIPYDRFKEVNTKNTTLTEELKTHKSKIDELNSLIAKSGDYEKTIKELNDKLEAQSQSHKKELYDRDFKAAFDKVLAESGSIDDVALKAHLKMDDIKLENGSIVGAAEQLAKIKQERAYLFKQDEQGKPGIKFGGKINDGEKKSGESPATDKLKAWNQTNRFNN